jgi:hypothetical protein
MVKKLHYIIERVLNQSRNKFCKNIIYIESYEEPVLISNIKRSTFHKFLYTLCLDCIYYESDLRDISLYNINFYLSLMFEGSFHDSGLYISKHILTHAKLNGVLYYQHTNAFMLGANAYIHMTGVLFSITSRRSNLFSMSK